MRAGAELSLIETIDALKKAQVDCYVVLRSDGPLVDELKRREIPFFITRYSWWVRKKSPPWNLPRAVVAGMINIVASVAIAARIRRWNCDIIYTNTITVCVGAIAAKLLRRPHVWHIHELGYGGHGFSFDLGNRISMWIMDRCSSICIANSHAVKRKFQEYFDEVKLRVVYNSLGLVPRESCETTQYENRIDPCMRCVLVGSLQEGKRQEDAVQAIAKLISDGLKVELLMVGAGDPKYYSHLQEMIVQKGVGSSIKFAGQLDDPFPLIRDADVLLMCSKCEAFGRVTVEAMLFGKPVIGARSCGTIELVSDGFNGYLYEPTDYEDLAEKIRYLYHNRDVAKKMGENGRQWANCEFNEERLRQELMGILEQVCPSKEPKPKDAEM
jgi:glycosyltransferase involved in cell wall biosynthesis